MGDRTVLVNIASLLGTTAVTSGLGFIFWLIAARDFPHSAVGLASAAVSAMMLLGQLATLGLTTLLIGELPRHPGRARPLIAAALVVTAAAGAAAGVLFAVIGPTVSGNLSPLSADVATTSLFALGVSLSAVVLVLDQALVGLLLGTWQFWRNTILAVSKIVALIVVTTVIGSRLGMSIYASWTASNVVSLVALGLFVLRKRPGLRSYTPQLGLLQVLGRSAVEHHAFNLTVMAPWLALPVIVTAVLSTSANADFYVASMVAGFLFLIPSAGTTVLFAVGAAETRALSEKIRLTLGLSIAAGVAANLVLLPFATPILGIFGARYAAEATGVLQILAVAVFPGIVKSHYVAVKRVRREVTAALPLVMLGTTLDIAAALAGAYLDGIEGVAIGWLLAETFQALMMGRAVYDVWRPRGPIVGERVGSASGLAQAVDQRPDILS